MEAVSQYLVTLLADKFDVDPDAVKPGSTLAELELDSLAVVELFVTVREQWGVELDDSDSAADLTVEDVARLVADQLPDDSGPVEATDPGTPR
ncbi:acyl carrier protein [Streptomyces liangshanensis]|uniref:Acyl carrier protein n=1 Tax=Streptomyces liangshanensis TaxID=2717324 RepID=A0A6G9GZS5_9ACTN|nr:acyl carrier protein [Streptomyces liangshanensis]QIQ03387.1 acyl carrier protein [Streptomyces liangshanensis]